ncbi:MULTISPECIES: VOC family protein [unclassified Paenibacillus]|uniref:VOC family protein n=1 Tax=unclassified Paenibacillus TaxID=185978 RepID=UPI0024061756|nr:MULTISPECIES: VOC family protein [unclassified Paenibacillus]MDF9843572.1 lactoylglutathione lyase [Paenibacillus sp. PastF-2]MDF9850160.1 lactoylglutathione lyase [Paenibacillus sp. PastM-2]MDF9857098.1 lactoylglutathione lyase [Paenibacillus sp. PastF-1]MDH6482369.1 lactoylglutathione lyase [Paenibacillus sp. PastH-2]MDH6509293.1 lactoylglutathione lyase [Paenibacillus sp. PastM-3]
MAVSKLEHIGIKVAQLEQSLAFYQEVIGLTLQDTIGEPGESLRLAFLSFPGQTSVEIELIERVWTGLPDEGKVSHVAFTVTLIEAEHSRIAALQLPGLTEISTLANGSRYFFFDGPDGEKLEFFESTRGK